MMELKYKYITALSTCHISDWLKSYPHVHGNISVFPNMAFFFLIHLSSDFHFSLQAKYFLFKKHAVKLFKREIHEEKILACGKIYFVFRYYSLHLNRKMTDKCLAREKHKPFKSLIVDINSIYFIIIFAILFVTFGRKS